MIAFKLNLARIAGLLLACLLLLPGCLSRSAPHVSYYSLLTMQQLGETEAISSLPEVRLGIGPITIPDSLKRSQIVTRSDGNQYAFDEYNRWAGILEKDLTAVIGDNLGQLLGVDKVGFFPWMHHFNPTYRVLIDVVRLDGDLAADAVLEARWRVTDTGGKIFLAGTKSEYRQQLDDASFASLIKAESQLVALLSKEIARAIVALAK